MKRKIDNIEWVTIIVMSLLAMYMLYYSFNNPELTRTQLVIDNLWMLPILVAASLVPMRNKKKWKQS